MYKKTNRSMQGTVGAVHLQTGEDNITELQMAESRTLRLKQISDQLSQMDKKDSGRKALQKEFAELVKMQVTFKQKYGKIKKFIPTFANIFMDVAKEKLLKHQFEMLIKEAYARQENSIN